jgi:hypothetical protein
MLNKYRERLQRLFGRWRELEPRIKEAELISGSVAIPAINELRYAGRRLFEAWLIADQEHVSKEDEERFYEHILQAEQYFNNADHDLTDGLVLFFLRASRNILEKWGAPKATEMYPRFIAWNEKINECREVIISSRGNRHNRFDDYNRLKDHLLPELITEYKNITRSEELYVRRDRRKLFFARLGYIVGIIGSIASVWSLLR